MKKPFIVTEANVDEIISAMGTFVRRVVFGAGKKGVVCGMSGGIDCCTVARICQKAQVPVALYILPDGDAMNKSTSMSDALLFCETFGFYYKTVDISPMCNAFEASISNLSKNAAINIRPRVRMTYLYAQAQNNDALVIGTGNYAERMMGYFTKWGDGACDLNPLAFLAKSEVRLVAKHLEIPENIISKAPSADLFEGQTDENEMGFFYEDIDGYLTEGTSGNPDIDLRIQMRIEAYSQKLKPIPLFED